MFSLPLDKPVTPNKTQHSPKPVATSVKKSFWRSHSKTTSKKVREKKRSVPVTSTTFQSNNNNKGAKISKKGNSMEDPEYRFTKTASRKRKFQNIEGDKYKHLILASQQYMNMKSNLSGSVYKCVQDSTIANLSEGCGLKTDTEEFNEASTSTMKRAASEMDSICDGPEAKKRKCMDKTDTAERYDGMRLFKWF